MWKRVHKMWDGYITVPLLIFFVPFFTFFVSLFIFLILFFVVFIHFSHSSYLSYILSIISLVFCIISSTASILYLTFSISHFLSPLSYFYIPSQILQNVLSFSLYHLTYSISFVSLSHISYIFPHSHPFPYFSYSCYVFHIILTLFITFLVFFI